MKILKKALFVIVAVLSMFLFVSCQKQKTIASKLTILTVNDLHGALDESSDTYGAARLANTFKEIVKKAEACVIISGGDMFQGTAISNSDRGKTGIDIMNEIKFDCMTLGNHEFDWGLDTMLAYKDLNLENGEANFDFLCCNIREKSTSEIPEHVKPYTIVERGGLKIAIIGYMGLESVESIGSKVVEPYDFLNPVPIVSNIAKELRTSNLADIIIVCGHEGSDSNELLTGLKDDSRIDAIVNSHTHIRYSGTLSRADGTKVPYVQAGSAGKYYGLIELTIDPSTKEVVDVSSVAKENKGQKDKKVDSLVQQLKDDTADIFERVIGKQEIEIDRYEATVWACDSLMTNQSAELAIINVGGIRKQAFPIRAGESIKVGKIYEIMPFDNYVKTLHIKGSYISSFMSAGLQLSSNVVKNNTTGEIFISGVLLDQDKLYYIATIDYVFDNSQFAFQYCNDSENTGKLLRDVLLETVETNGIIG